MTGHSYQSFSFRGSFPTYRCIYCGCDSRSDAAGRECPRSRPPATEDVEALLWELEHTRWFIKPHCWDAAYRLKQVADGLAAALRAEHERADEYRRPTARATRGGTET